MRKNKLKSVNMYEPLTQASGASVPRRVFQQLNQDLDHSQVALFNLMKTAYANIQLNIIHTNLEI